MDSALQQEVKAKLEALVENQDEDARVQFSTDLSAGDRYHIHEMAEARLLRRRHRGPAAVPGPAAAPVDEARAGRGRAPRGVRFEDVQA